MPVSGLGMRVFAAPFAGPSKKGSVAVIVEFDPSRFRFQPTGNGGFAEDIELIILPVNASGKPLEGTRDKAPLRLAQRTYDLVRANGLRMVRRLDLPPGRYQLHVAAKASNGNAVGGLAYDLDVPDFSKPALAMSGLAVMSESAGADPDAPADTEFMIGGEGDPAKAAVEAALNAGKPVVTANKALMAHHGLSLARLAEKAGVALAFEASVAGAIPVVKTLRESLSGNQVRQVFVILNGTCNFILTKMSSEGAEFADVLREAQRLAMPKPIPLSTLAASTRHTSWRSSRRSPSARPISLEFIYIEGIETITRADIVNADELGYRIKLLGVAVMTDDGVEQRVHPTLVPKGTPIADVEGVDNAA